VLTIDQETSRDDVVCQAAREIEAFTVSKFRQALAEMAPARRLVIDLSRISFVDSAGLGL